jgi:hypothetical protein
VRGFGEKLDRGVPMYFYPTDTFYFPSHDVLKKFMRRDARSSHVQTLNNSSIESIAIGSLVYWRENGTINPIYGTRRSWNNGGNSAVARLLSQLLGLRKIVFVIPDSFFPADRESVHPADLEQMNYPDSSKVELNAKLLTCFRSTFELSLLRLSEQAISKINNKPNGWQGHTLPVVASQWWKSPKIIIVSSAETLLDEGPSGKLSKSSSVIYHLLTCQI